MADGLGSALEGITVCDLSWVGAGPIATNILGQCGAEIIKIESRKRPDILRKSGPFKDGNGEGLERSGYFANRNPNKKSISLNMADPRAREVVVRLIQKSDIVINNFRVGQMERWNLGWEDVKKINPRIIYVTMSLQGISGPHSEYMGFGVNLNALCGLTHRTGMPGERPFGTGTNYTDHVMVPTHSLFAVMAALLHREKTGRGQTVSVSQLESAIAMKPMDPMCAAAGGEIMGPSGAKDSHGAPHGVYRTLGYRKWIAVAVFGEGEWGLFKEVMGNPGWAEAERFQSLARRKENEAELDERIEAWTSGQHGDRLMETLLENGVKAGMANDARAVVENPHHLKRGYWSYLDHPVTGSTLYNRGPMIFSETPVKMTEPAPLLGQHTKEVLTGMLGFSEAEVEALADEDVLT